MVRKEGFEDRIKRASVDRSGNRDCRAARGGGLFGTSSQQLETVITRDSCESAQLGSAGRRIQLDFQLGQSQTSFQLQVVIAQLRGGCDCSPEFLFGRNRLGISELCLGYLNPGFLNRGFELQGRIWVRGIERRSTINRFRGLVNLALN